ARRYQGLFPGLELTEHRIQSLDDFNAPVRVHLEGTAPQVALRDGRTLRVAPTLLHDLTQNLAPTPSREHPLELGLRSTYVEERVIEVPRGWTVGELPDGGTVESDFGRLAVEVRRDGRGVRARTELV